jgi:uncharacterized protein (DUF1501 family)
MTLSRRAFIRSGAAACTVGLAAPRLLVDCSSAQTARPRALVVLHLTGGNDGLSTLVPYTDPFYYERRPTLAVPAASVLPIGIDGAGHALGFHPALPGLRAVLEEGRLAVIQRAGHPAHSRSHFLETDVWSTADPLDPRGTGWLGRYLDRLPPPVDPLAGWSTAAQCPHSFDGERPSAPVIPDPGRHLLSDLNVGDEAALERAAVGALFSHPRPSLPHVVPVAATGEAALATLDRVKDVAQYTPAAAYPAGPLGLAFKTVAGAIAVGVGTRVFWVEAGGYDTHAGQGTNGGLYATLLQSLDGALHAFRQDLAAQGLWNDTLLVQFSEFGRRITENSSRGTDHGAASVMLAMGGMVRGGIYGTAASLDPDPGNPALEEAGSDVRFETDFRAVYARVIDGWLGADAAALLGGDFLTGAPAFL